MKLCINCIHHEDGRCYRKGKITDLVTGKVSRKNSAPCWFDRGSNPIMNLFFDLCGIEAMYFKQKIDK